jgi:hypothetical protein
MSERTLSARELAVEFTDLWHGFEPEQINTMLARNVSMELLEFFSNYANEFADQHLDDDDDAVSPDLRSQLPNLLIIGYIIRILEERID